MGESWVCRDGFGRDDGLGLRRSWVWSVAEGLGLRRVGRNWGEVGFDLLLGRFGLQRIGCWFFGEGLGGREGRREKREEGGGRGLGPAVEKKRRENRGEGGNGLSWAC